MSEARPWHRLFGLTWVDFFRGTSVQVELEKDLSEKQQLLDVILIRPDGADLPRRMPDGMEDLAPHNLISFKSYQEALDGWAIKELIGHYVNYRKQISPSMRDLLPETDFRLFLVCVRFPHNLPVTVNVPLTPLQPGVHDLRIFADPIRVIVAHQLREVEHNALLHLFSAQMDLLRYGAEHYQIQSNETSTLLLQLFERYQVEVSLMPDVLEEFADQTINELLEKLPAERRIKGLSADQLFAALPPETRSALAKRLAESESGAKDQETEPENGSS